MENNNEQAYHSPEKLLEDICHPATPPFIIQLCEEEVELNKKIDKLQEFLTNGLGSKPTFDPVQRDLLENQSFHMQRYSEILTKRIELLNKEIQNME